MRELSPAGRGAPIDVWNGPVRDRGIVDLHQFDLEAARAAGLNVLRHDVDHHHRMTRARPIGA